MSQLETTPDTTPWLREASLVATELRTDPATGLSDETAAERLAADGPNELRPTPPEPLWRKVLRQFQDPLVYLLLVAMVVSLAAWLVEGGGGFPVDVVVIGAIVLANAAIGLVQENSAQNAVAALADMTRAMATVERQGRLVTVPSAELVRGDVLVLAEGDAVGADARLLSATGLTVEEASLTGESEATIKDPAALSGKVSLGDRTNMVFKGTAVVQGVGRAVVTATGMDTQMGEIAQLLDDTVQEPSPLQRELAKVSKMLGILVIGIAVVVMVALVIINGATSASELVEILLLGVALAVAAVPEGLPAILSLVLAIGVRAMARRNAVMKNLHSVETLGAASVICSDKTGTLTRNQMTVRVVVTASGETVLGGTGYEPVGSVGETSAEALGEARRVLWAGAVANDAQLTRSEQGWEIQGDPTEAAFLVAQRKVGDASDVEDFERRGEVPFNSARKMMSVAGRAPRAERDVLLTKGAPDVLLHHCSARLVEDAAVPLDDEARSEISRLVERLSGEGYRTLGVAWRELPDGDDPAAVDADDEQGLVFAGVVGIIDPPREEAAVAIGEAHRAGIRTIMITGDHPRTAARIAADLGIAEPGARALTGAQLDELDDEQFRQATRDVSIYARVSPEHKLRIVDALQADDQIVAMTGDGVNDAPALKSADIGVAMGITGTEVTKEAATMILADDNYATIVSAVRQGRAIFDNIRKFLRYLLSSNMGEVITVFFGVVLAGFIGLTGHTEAGGIVAPLLAVQILWINLVTDSGPALAMGVDPEDGDVMARAPRSTREPIINRAMWGRIGFVGAVMGATTLLTIDMFLPGGLIEGNDTVDVARTAGFTTLVLAQLFNALNSRSDLHSAFSGFFSNRWLWGSILLAVVLQFAVVEVPFLQHAFGTASLDLKHWLAAIAMSSLVLWTEEIAKLARRLSRR